MDKKRQRQFPSGTKPHGNGIQIKFKPAGFSGYCYETLPWSPTPANIEKAGKLRKEIVDAIKHGVFSYAEYFPNSRNAYTTNNSFYYYAQLWLDSPDNDWKDATRYKFKGVLQRVWIPILHDKPIRLIKYSTIADVLKQACDQFKAKHDKEISVSLYNDWLTCVRGPFREAIKDQVLAPAEDPTAWLTNKTRILTEPDPFEVDEADAIIEDIYRRDGDMWGAFFELGFYSGLRYPSEPAALIWPNVTLKQKTMTISQIRTKQGIQLATKTKVARTVLLNSRAEHALKVARKLTGTQDSFVFLQSNGPVMQGDPQRAMFRAAMKRLGIRQRDMYCMRHTYATFGLMNNTNPAWMAGQLGHSVEEFFKTYTKWIEGQQSQHQIGLIEGAIKDGAKAGQKTTTPIQLADIAMLNGAKGETRNKK